ncbi:orotidine-5'-phosphate decarboxylase [Hydrogenobacter hydrogenophilus]|uniref:Orotidine 5'-phosphate decarboxylase n=1 Tax=Hydrogenobacter hydrogenophilus TaxID=35835 RepID=A0A285P042_9AQUI|nr:orotidine-5'-phosphate decarboxylase [Hydrogenobacter hydrogenophilus]SNZ15112.1 orotidine-5'-phosphate decarboxylase [Hydrogenobacter hydrogenophilus]
MAKLCIALDTDYAKAKEILKALIGYPVIFKVGYKLFISHHKAITSTVKEMNFELFLDLKLHDIPNTVKNAVVSSLDLSADYLTIHALCGRDALRMANQVKGNMKLLSVTLLTSLDENFLTDLGIDIPVAEFVYRLAKLSVEEGLDGVVCSGKEVSFLKSSIKKEFLAVVPGVSLDRGKADQKRSVSLEEALEKGADIIVVGRDIVQDQNPIKKVDYILKKMA